MYSVFLRLLKERGVKASDVSKATGIPQSTFSDWKKGRSKPKDEKLQKIADYFGVTTHYLRTGKESQMISFDGDAVLSALQKAELEINKANDLFVKKFSMLTPDDQVEIINIIDMKLGRYREKENENLA